MLAEKWMERAEDVPHDRMEEIRAFLMEYMSHPGYIIENDERAEEANRFLTLGPRYLRDLLAKIDKMERMLGLSDVPEKDN